MHSQLACDRELGSDGGCIRQAIARVRQPTRQQKKQTKKDKLWQKVI